MTIEASAETDPRSLIAALTPTKKYWGLLAERFECLDETVHAVVMSPLFQYTYSTAHGASLEDMILDVRSGTGLMANQLFCKEELYVFVELGLSGHLNIGLALAARHLRPRAPTIPAGSFVEFARNVALTFILRVIGEDMKDPRPVFNTILGRMNLTEAQQMSLLQVSLVNSANRSSQIVHH